MKFLLRSALIGAAAVAATPVYAAMVTQMNLEGLVNSSERVFVGEVVSITESRVTAGGGELPAVTYKFKVSESFKGEYTTIKGVRIAEVKMIGRLKDVMAGRHPIAGFPVLQSGEEYLLMVAPASPRTGLTAFMGLGQGCFHVTGKEDSKIAVNAANNAGLFNNMSTSLTGSDAISYARLSALIRTIVGGAQ